MRSPSPRSHRPRGLCPSTGVLVLSCLGRRTAARWTLGSCNNPLDGTHAERQRHAPRHTQILGTGDNRTRYSKGDFAERTSGPGDNAGSSQRAPREEEDRPAGQRGARRRREGARSFRNEAAARSCQQPSAAGLREHRPSALRSQGTESRRQPNEQGSRASQSFETARRPADVSLCWTSGLQSGSIYAGFSLKKDLFIYFFREEREHAQGVGAEKERE